MTRKSGPATGIEDGVNDSETSAPAGREPLAITIAQFRSLIPLSRTTVYEKINDGSLRTLLVGRRRLILWSSVEALVRDSEVRLR